ncbi:MAG TPA: response regulator transcription factor [Solirubrobacteraceae bacterium]
MVDGFAEWGGVLQTDELVIKLDEGLVRAGGRVLTLSVREFQLLVTLVRRSGGILGRAELYRAVWGRELRPGDRSVDVYVSKLRTKLASALPGQRFIHTHPGFGYRFQPQASRNLDNPRQGFGQTAGGDHRSHVTSNKETT